MTGPYKGEGERFRRHDRAQLKQDRTFLLNLMSSPGSGRTTTLLRTPETLRSELCIGVMEADIDSDVEAWYDWLREQARDWNA